MYGYRLCHIRTPLPLGKFEKFLHDYCLSLQLDPGLVVETLEGFLCYIPDGTYLSLLKVPNIAVECKEIDSLDDPGVGYGRNLFIPIPKQGDDMLFVRRADSILRIFLRVGIIDENSYDIVLPGIRSRKRNFFFVFFTNDTPLEVVKVIKTMLHRQRWIVHPGHIICSWSKRSNFDVSFSGVPVKVLEPEKIVYKSGEGGHLTEAA